MNLDLNSVNKNTSSEKLKIVLQKEITTYLNYSLPLCSILWNENKKMWLYEHFTQLYCINNENIWLDYLEDLYFPSDVTDYSFVNSDEMKNIDDIILYIKEKISQKYYIFIYLDKFYLRNSNTNSYLKDHEPLFVFIYGYDDFSKQFNGIGFSNDSYFGFLNYSYENVSKAYKSCKLLYQSAPIWVTLYTCTLIKVKEPEKTYSFHLSRFLNDLRNYLKSTGDKSLLRPEIKVVIGEKATYGINVHDEIVNHLNNLLTGKHTMDYRQIHLIAEHKKLLLKKIKFIDSVFNFDKEFKSIIDKYSSVVDDFIDIKFLYLNSVFTDESFKGIYGPLKDRSVINRIINTFINKKTDEEKVLTDICDYLSTNIPNDKMIIN